MLAGGSMFSPGVTATSTGMVRADCQKGSSRRPSTFMGASTLGTGSGAAIVAAVVRRIAAIVTLFEWTLDKGLSCLPRRKNRGRPDY